MQIAKPTIAGAVASITKAAKQLEAVITAGDKRIAEARKVIADADATISDANADVQRAARIKAKLEELVA